MNSERIFSVLQAAHISEKASIVAEKNNQYVFKVSLNATKLEVKKAIEKIFSVKVKSVTTLTSKGKVKRNKYGLSKRQDSKTAYVRLAEGHQIDLSVVE